MAEDSSLDRTDQYLSFCWKSEKCNVDVLVFYGEGLKLSCTASLIDTLK